MGDAFPLHAASACAARTSVSYACVSRTEEAADDDRGGAEQASSTDGGGGVLILAEVT